MNGQTAIVTGGSRGIGKAIANALAKKGVNVVVAATDLAKAEAVAAEIMKLGVKGRAIKCNVSEQDEVINLFETVQRDFGRLEILVNNAGITRDTLTLRMKEEDWDAVIDVNLKGAFLCSKEALKIMVRQKYGRIINISSVAAFIGNIGQANYSASKAGLVGLTKTLAMEYASRSITINAIAPGFIKTDMTDSIPETIKQQILKTIPLCRFGEVEDIASAVVFLSSMEQNYITGQVLHINGGLYV